MAKLPKVVPAAGWAIYLRTSDADAQNPQNSQDRQRLNILKTLVEPSGLSVLRVYIDNDTGRNNHRPQYQQMLEDARLGHFSHIGADSPDRWGREGVEALRSVKELVKQNIQILFASMPQNNAQDPDQRLILNIFFMLSENESDRLGLRTRGGLHTKMRNGGFVGRAPDGYRNAESKTASEDKLLAGRYTRWIEPDPEQWQVWRTA